MTTATEERLERVSAEGALEMGLAGGGWLRYGVTDLGEVVEEARGRLDLFDPDELRAPDA